MVRRHRERVDKAMGWRDARRQWGAPSQGPALAPILWNIAIWVVLLLVLAVLLKQLAPQYFTRPSGGWGSAPGSRAQPAEPAASAMPQPKPRRDIQA